MLKQNICPSYSLQQRPKAYVCPSEENNLQQSKENITD